MEGKLELNIFEFLLFSFVTKTLLNLDDSAILGIIISAFHCCFRELILIVYVKHVTVWAHKKKATTHTHTRILPTHTALCARLWSYIYISVCQCHCWNNKLPAVQRRREGVGGEQIRAH